jgi:FkbM family methyltransferase
MEYVSRSYCGIERKIYCNLSGDKRAQKISSTLPNYIYPISHIVWKYLVLVGNWDYIVDVGSNYGEFIVDALEVNASKSDAQCEYLCIEPAKSVLPYLQKTADQYRGQVRIYDIALSSTAGTFQFRDSVNFSGGSRLLEENAPISESVATYEVNTETLDALLKKRKRYLIKIDVEGHEIDVMRGCSEIIASSLECVFLLEMNHISATQVAQEFPGGDVYLFSKYRGCLIRNPKIFNLPKFLMKYRDLYLHDGVLTFESDPESRKYSGKILSAKGRVNHLWQKFKWAQTGSNRRPTD